MNLLSYCGYFKPVPASPTNPQQKLIDAVKAYCDEKKPTYDFKNFPIKNVIFTGLCILSNENVVPYVHDFFFYLNGIKLSATSPFLNLFDNFKDASMGFGLVFFGFSQMGIPWNNIFLGINLGIYGKLAFDAYNMPRPNVFLNKEELIKNFKGFEEDPNYNNIINCKRLGELENWLDKLIARQNIVPRLISS